MFHVKQDIQDIAEETLSSDTLSLTMQNEDRDRKIDQFLDAVFKENWANNFLILALTAGPVTYLGLNVGYYIGYGTFPPFQLFIYFAAFTAIAGLLGFVLRVAEHVNKERRESRAGRLLVVAMGILPRLIQNSRELQLQHLSEEVIAQEAALLILKNSHPQYAELREAFYVLTNNDEIATQLCRIRIYEEVGFFSRSQLIRQDIEPEIKKCLEALETERPDVAYWLERHYKGKPPSLKEGLPRNESFIERLLVWSETDTDEYLRTRDIDELLTLVMELLCGREIPLLSTSYSGKNEIGIIAEQLHAARASYRVANAARFSRIKSIARYFQYEEDFHDSIPTNFRDATKLLSLIEEQIDVLCEDINKLKSVKASKTRESLRKLKRKTELLQNVIGFYRELLTAHRRAEKREDNLRRLIQKWRSICQEIDGSIGLLSVDKRQTKRREGIVILQRMIRLNNHEKIRLVRQTYPLIKHMNDNIVSLNIDDYKKLVVELLTALDPLIYITSADTQRAIELSNAPNFISIHSSFSAEAKTLWATNYTRELETDMARMAERLFRALITQYNLALDNAAIDFFVTNYNADREKLETMLRTLERDTAMPPLSQLEKLNRKPNLKKTWMQTLSEATTTLRLAGQKV